MTPVESRTPPLVTVGVIIMCARGKSKPCRPQIHERGPPESHRPAGLQRGRHPGADLVGAFYGVKTPGVLLYFAPRRFHLVHYRFLNRKLAGGYLSEVGAAAGMVTGPRRCCEGCSFIAVL